MARRFLTAEDVRRVSGGSIQVAPTTVVTPQAIEQARQSGVEILVEGGGAWSEPAPDRGPDAAEATDDSSSGDSSTGDSSTGGGVILTAVGRNRPGVLAEITGVVAGAGAGIRDVSQKMVGDYFHLLLVLELSSGVEFAGLKERLQCLGGDDDYVVRVMHERVFRFMHRV